MEDKLLISNQVCQTLYNDLRNIASDDYFQNVSDKHFLITGGNGFIAYYMALSLMTLNDVFNRNNKITLLVRNESRCQLRYGELLKRDDLDLLVQDVCQSISDNHHFDYIIHAASPAEAKYFDEDPIGVFNSNVLGAENVISYIRQHSCISTVCLSSFTVYGQIDKNMDKIPEDYNGPDDWCNNRASYAYGKRSAEFLCMAAQRKYGCNIKIVRPGFVYGASSQNDTRVYAEVIRCVANKQNIILGSPGYLYRSMIYVSDLVRGIFAVLFRGKDGEAYNIANEHISIRHFAETAKQEADSKLVKLLFKNQEDQYAEAPTEISAAMDISKIKADCGWEPCISLSKGISMAADIYLSENKG